MAVSEEKAEVKLSVLRNKLTDRNDIQEAFCFQCA